MSFSRSEELGRFSGKALVALSALVLAGCAGTSKEGMPEAAAAPPPPAPMAMGAPPPPPVFRVASGSPSVLEEYPRGTEITQEDSICLDEGEQLNIIGSNGQRASYEGPGCMRRSETEGGENVGGFIFGSNSRSQGSVQMELAE